MAAPTIFSRFLTSLGVPHTDSYSDAQFRSMTFRSLYGLSHLLTTYGVPNRGINVSDKSELEKITPPFLAQTRRGVFVIVNDIDKAAGCVTYDTFGKTERIDTADFIKAWNGIALLAFPERDSREPEYMSHRTTDFVASASKYAVVVAAMVVFAYFFITRHVYGNVSTVALTLLDLAGLYFSFLLLQKSLNIHTAASDRVCGVLEHGGCDRIMELKVSKLFGVFSWSEVGFGYFSVSLATLLVFPHLWPALALCNICCLPYTFWSIWYQRFRAHHWCTLCVAVQTTLWLKFFCFLFGGWIGRAFPIEPDFVILVAVYVFAVLFINLVIRSFKNLPGNENNSNPAT